jgi:hypothetical protein
LDRLFVLLTVIDEELFNCSVTVVEAEAVTVPWFQPCTPAVVLMEMLWLVWSVNELLSDALLLTNVLLV